MTKIKLDIDTDENLAEVKVLLVKADNTLKVITSDGNTTPVQAEVVEPLKPKSVHKGFDPNMMDIVNR